jgi:putative cardiolipin synthase
MFSLRVILPCLLSLLALPAVADDNEVQVIHHGVAAFERRLEMIERAEHTIDIEYFIYEADDSGRIFTQALAAKKAANPNLRIRILLDSSWSVLEMKKAYVAEFAAHGIEVRYWNVRGDKIQHRDHRKLVIVDGKEAITGGRNIGDDYFDLDPKANFLDRDIWMKGPIVPEIAATFEKYWKSKLSVDATKAFEPRTPKQVRARVEAARKFFVETSGDRVLRAAIRNVGRPILADKATIGKCEKLSFVTDEPGFAKSDRRVIKGLFERMNRMENGETLRVESPYFIVKDAFAQDQMKLLKERNIRGILLTNSLKSTDAWYVAANFYPQISFYKSISDAEMFVYGGEAPKNYPAIRYLDGTRIHEKAVWGIHAKSFVFGEDSFAIGTFNLDPRSANLNSEILVFCDGSRELARNVTDSMLSRTAQSDVLDRNGMLPGGKAIDADVDPAQRRKFRAGKYPAMWFADYL